MEYARGGAHFSEATHRIDLTAEQRFVGEKTRDVFDSEIKRPTPWLVKRFGENQYRLYELKTPRKIFSNLETVPPEDLAKISVRVITSEQLAKEQLSEEVGESILTFKRIEDKLTDFMREATLGYRNYRGLSMASFQWGNEEYQHSNAEEMILVSTGYATKQELDEDYAQNSRLTWEAPFPTTRQMVIYAYFQEMLTKLNYLRLADTAEKQGAPTVAEVLRIIGRDEGYHGEGYNKFVQTFYEFDPEGTIRDVALVALNFRMPAQHLMRDQVKDGMNIMRAKAFSKKMVSEETLYQGLKHLGFMDDELSREIANKYWEQQKVTAPLYEESRDNVASMIGEMRMNSGLVAPNGKKIDSNGNGHTDLAVSNGETTVFSAQEASSPEE